MDLWNVGSWYVFLNGISDNCWSTGIRVSYNDGAWKIIPQVPPMHANVNTHKKNLSNTIETYFQSSTTWKNGKKMLDYGILRKHITGLIKFVIFEKSVLLRKFVHASYSLFYVAYYLKSVFLLLFRKIHFHGSLLCFYYKQTSLLCSRYWRFHQTGKIHHFVCHARV